MSHPNQTGAPEAARTLTRDEGETPKLEPEMAQPKPSPEPTHRKMGPGQGGSSQGSTNLGPLISPSDQPLILQPEVLDIVREHGWRKLASNPTWRPKLAQWCCLCGTWCVSNRAVKMHLAKSHKAVWTQHKHRIETLCKTQLADITVPCGLCGSVSKDPKAHVVACPVLFQSLLISLVTTDGTRSGSELLQALATSGKSTEHNEITERNNSNPFDNTTVDQAAQNGRAAAGKTTATQGQATRAKHATGAGQPGSGHQQTCGGHRQANIEAGGRTSTTASGLRLHLVREHGAGGEFSP